MDLAVRGLRFTVDLGGPDDGEPVLLLHGFPQHSGEWSRVLPGLHAAGLRTVTVDQRGYPPGARPAEVEDYRITECALDAAAIMDALGYADMHVVGHDWGAICAWHLTLRMPERVRTLTAISVAHPFAMARAYAEDLDNQRERSSYITFFRRHDRAEEILLEDDGARLRAMFTGSGLDDAGVDSYVRPMLDQPGRLTGALNWYRAMGAGDLIGIGSATRPTTFLWSDGDIAIGRGAAEACAEHVDAEYRFVALEGVSHWIPDEVPDAVVAAVLDRVLP